MSSEQYLKKPESLEEAKAILEGREIDFGAHTVIRWLIAEVESANREIEHLNNILDKARRIVAELKAMI